VGSYPSMVRGQYAGSLQRKSGEEGGVCSGQRPQGETSHRKRRAAPGRGKKGKRGPRLSRCKLVRSRSSGCGPTQKTTGEKTPDQRDPTPQRVQGKGNEGSWSVRLKRHSGLPHFPLVDWRKRKPPSGKKNNPQGGGEGKMKVSG